MIKSIFLLTKLQIRNLFGFNEARFARDPKKKKRVRTTIAAFLILGAVLFFYAAGLSFALASFGFSEVVPTYLGLLVFGLVFGLGIFRAGSIFDVKSYEKLAVLPVSKTAIVASKFLTLYVTNFLFAFVVATSGAIATVFAVGFDLWFILSTILSSVFLPLFPMTLALLIGSVIYAVSSRFKKNNLLSTLLTCIFVFAMMLLPASLETDMPDSELIGGIASMLSSLQRVLLPLAWLGAGTRVSGIGYYLLFIFSSVGVFAAYSFVVGKFYKNICSALSAKAANASFKGTEKVSRKPLFALYFRELKRYMSCSIYFMNTAMGNILAIIASISMLFMGADEFLVETGIPSAIISKLAPFLIAMINLLSPLTACAISIEGKGWELTKSLPLPTKTVMNAKLLLQLTFSIPASIISCICIGVALKISGWNLLWLFVVPLVLCLFSAVSGLYVNAKNPCFTWDNESVPVKQSSAVLISMLIALASGIVPMLLIAIIPTQFSGLAVFVVVGAVCAVGEALYKKLTSMRLNDIDEK
ncbi:MAG: hypothetical protein IKA72_00930 [Clostridia bacterium]|nr:hypothetical protein [Clostridia bacterium]